MWLTKLATNSKGETLVFIPAVAYAILIVGTGMFLLNNWDGVKKAGWGNWKLLVALGVIVVTMGLSGINANGLSAMFAPGLFGVSMLAFYFAARFMSLSGDAKWLVAPVLVVGGIAVIVSLIMGVVSPGCRDCGLLTNYCALVGLIVLSGLLLDRRWLWIAVAPIVLAVLLTGALEGVFILGVLLIAVLVRRDWGRKILLPVGIIVVAIVPWIATGVIGDTYAHTDRNFAALLSFFGIESEYEYEDSEGALDEALTGRWVVIRDAMQDISWTGHGYVVTPVPTEGDRRPVHNMPLHAVDQIGPFGAAAWLFATLFCLIRTRWKYIWIAVLATSVFDYYIWTQLAPHWWMLVALSTTGDDKPDFIFRRRDGQEESTDNGNHRAGWVVPCRAFVERRLRGTRGNPPSQPVQHRKDRPPVQRLPR